MRPARRSRRVGVLVAAAALVLSAFGPASYADLSSASPAPAYLSGQGVEFYASANKAWSAARELTPDASSNPLGKPPGKHDPDTVVWTKKCSRQAQTAVFRRELKLPGRPTSSTFNIAAVVPLSASNVFKTFKLEVNGATVAQGSLAGTTASGRTVTLAPKALEEFTDGGNLVAVTVKRGALATTQKTCNTSDADRYGVTFRFAGEFGADLALADAPLENFEYRKAGTSNTTITNITLRNLGPSAAVAGGRFWLTINGVTEVTLLGDLTTPVPGTYPSEPPLDHCVAKELTPAPNLSVMITCDLGAIPVGTVAHLSIGTRLDLPSTEFSETRTSIQWDVGHPVDSTPYDNRRVLRYVWCGTRSTTAGCVALG